MQTLTERVERLERSARRWRLLACISSLAIVIGVSLGLNAADPRAQEDNRLVFKDSAGNVRLVVGRSQEKEQGEFFGVWYFDPSGQPLGGLTAGSGACWLELHEQEGHRRATALSRIEAQIKNWNETAEKIPNALTPQLRDQWRLAIAKDRERASHLGPVKATVAAGGVTLVEEGNPEASDPLAKMPTITRLTVDGLVVPGVVIFDDVFGQLSQPTKGAIRVLRRTDTVFSAPR